MYRSAAFPYVKVSPLVLFFSFFFFHSSTPQRELWPQEADEGVMPPDLALGGTGEHPHMLCEGTKVAALADIAPRTRMTHQKGQRPEYRTT